MNIYSETSKRIGWEPQPIDIPSIEKAKELLEQICIHHSREAFETVFKLHRFAPVSKTEDQFEAMQIIYYAFEKGRYLFDR